MSLEFRGGAELGLECTPGKWQHVGLLVGESVRGSSVRCGRAGGGRGRGLELQGSAPGGPAEGPVEFGREEEV